jgi:Fe-S cluster assembly ATP-binding protein
VNNTYFLKAALNANRKARGEDPLDAMDFLKLVREKVKLVELDEDLINRPVNEGFSGGEKKRNEIFQMPPEPSSRSSTRPTRLISTPPDRRHRRERLGPDRAMLVITHYRGSNISCPDFVHVLSDASWPRGSELALKLSSEARAGSRPGRP